MYALVVASIYCVLMCEGTSISYQYKDIATKSKIQLSPVEITCRLNDIVVLATPVVNCDDVLYHLHKPNGDIIRLDFSGPKSKLLKFNKFYNTYAINDALDDYRDNRRQIIVKYINKDVKTIYPKKNHKILQVDHSDSEKDDVIRMAEKKMNKNDFILGPLLQEDHGNWVLSVYCKDIDGEWIEMFQTISITLICPVPMKYSEVTLREGSTFNLSFLYPIKDLETCELTVPDETPDRYFDRNRIELDKCGYVVTNVTKKDQGLWRVIGVGKIVYEGKVRLRISENVTSENDVSFYDEFL